MNKRIDMMRARLVTDKNPIAIEKLRITLETEAQNADDARFCPAKP